MARLDGRVATALLLVAALTAHISLENLAQAERDEGKEKKAGTAIDAADANTTVKTGEQIEEKREKKSGEEEGDADALESHDEVVCCGQNDRNVKPESYATNRALCKDECKELGSEGGQKYGTQGDGDPGTCFSGMKCREAKKSKTLGAIGKQPVEAEVVGSKSKKGSNFVSDLTDIQVSAAPRSMKNRPPYDDDGSSDEEEEELRDETKQDRRNAIVLIEAVLNICNRCSHRGDSWDKLKVKEDSRQLDDESLIGWNCEKLAERLCSLTRTKGKSGCTSEKSCNHAATFTIKKYSLQRLFGQGTETQRKLSDRSKCNPRCQKQ